MVDLGYDAYLTSQWNKLEPITDEALKLCQRARRPAAVTIPWAIAAGQAGFLLGR
jgi:hypothetical protein